MATRTTTLLLLIAAILILPTVLAGDEKKDRFDYGYGDGYGSNYGGYDSYGGGYDSYGGGYDSYGGGYDSYGGGYDSYGGGYDDGYGRNRKDRKFSHDFDKFRFDDNICLRVQPSIRFIQYGDFQYKTISLRGLPKDFFYAFTAVFQNQITFGDGPNDRCPDAFIDKKSPWLARIRAETCPEHEDRLYRLFFAAFRFKAEKCKRIVEKKDKKDDKKYDDYDDKKKDSYSDSKSSYDDKKDDKKKDDKKKDDKKDDKKYMAGLYGYDDYGYDDYDSYGKKDNKKKDNRKKDHRKDRKVKVFQCIGYVDIWVYGSNKDTSYAPGGLVNFAGPWYDSTVCTPKNNKKY